MIALNPYAMIIGGAYQNKLSDQLNASEVWSALECNRAGRVYRIPVAMIGIKNIGAETPVMLKYIAGLFNENYSSDIHKELKENIKNYFGYNLSDADVDNMCAGLIKDGKTMVL